MEDAIPSISTAGVGSRFVSQDELEDAKARRDEQWRAAYARYRAVFLMNSYHLSEFESTSDIPQTWARTPAAASGRRVRWQESG